jgi:hypothetical protein
MEKVEILYRTARAQNNSTNTSEQIRSRLRDSVAPTRCCEPRELAKALGSGPAAREYHRRAIMLAAKIVDWIFSYRVRRRSGAARGAWTSAGRSGRVSWSAAHVGAIGADAPAVAVEQAGGEAAAVARNESFRCGIFPNVA